VRNTHCKGERWSHGENWPICTKNTCDTSKMLDIPYGQGKALMHGAVYKYRCNPGTQMEGRDTVACTGRLWNGTVPACNVEPNKPKLELLVSGSPVKNVKVGDVVKASCQSRGGNPVPEVGLLLDDEPYSAATQAFREFSSHFTFLATTEFNGKTIKCITRNKIGTTSAEKILTILSPPTSLDITGPLSLQQNNNYTYKCAVTGGTPRPSITWMVDGEPVQGNDDHDDGDVAHSSLNINTDDGVRGLSVTCQAENSEGVLSKALHVNMEYLPSSIQIHTPASVREGDLAHVSCVLSKSFPPPVVTWQLVYSGDETETYEKVADLDSARDDEETWTVEEDFRMDGLGLEYVEVSCVAGVEGLGSVASESEIEIEYDADEYITTTEDGLEDQPVDDLFQDFVLNPDHYANENETEEYADDYDEPLDMKQLKHDNKNKKSSANKNDIDDNNNKMDAKKSDEDDKDDKDAPSYDNDATTIKESERRGSPKLINIVENYDDDDIYSENYVRLASSSAEDISESSAKSDVLWIPYASDEDIKEYQDTFAPGMKQEEFIQADVDDADAVAGSLRQEKESSPSVMISDQPGSSSALKSASLSPSSSSTSYHTVSFVSNLANILLFVCVLKFV